MSEEAPVKKKRVRRVTPTPKQTWEEFRETTRGMKLTDFDYRAYCCQCDTRMVRSSRDEAVRTDIRCDQCAAAWKRRTGLSPYSVGGGASHLADRPAGVESISNSGEEYLQKLREWNQKVAEKHR